MVRSSPMVVVMCLASILIAAAGEPKLRSEMLVSGEQLESQLARGGKNLVILHVGRDRAKYAEAHIPGARYLDLSSIWTERNGVVNELPEVAHLEKRFAELGVGNKSRVVLYDESRGMLASRAYFTLDYLGHGKRTALLDGGLESWKRAGRKVSRDEPPAPKPARFRARVRPEIVVDLATMKRVAAAKAGKVAIIDSRPRAEFTGEKESERVPRPGHIPGAKNVYWVETLASAEDPRLKPAAELRAMFAAAGAETGGKVVTYCRTGVQAAHGYFTAKYLGYEAAMYDGSFSEWSAQNDTPVKREASAVRTPGAASARKVRSEMLVTTEWLAEHLHDPKVVVLHSGWDDKTAYDKEHIPGARYVQHEIYDMEPPRYEMPAVEKLKAAMEELGISRDTKVVIYSSNWWPWAARAYFTLDYLGHDNVALLDGGLAKWKREGRPTTAEAPKVTKGSFTPKPRPELIMSYEEVARLSQAAPEGTAVIDARPPRRYELGHVPGAASLFWEQTVVSPAEPLLKPAEELRKLYADAGATKRSVSYCEVGIQGAHAYFVAKYLGLEAQLYDGSFAEWSRKEGTQVVTGSARR